MLVSILLGVCVRCQKDTLPIGYELAELSLCGADDTGQLAREASSFFHVSDSAGPQEPVVEVEKQCVRER